MRCIFCKSASSSSRSVEHIVPESLGNLSHVLPCGVVCDKCNNYLALEVEKPFLESAWIRRARHRQGIPNKRQRIPSIEAIHLESLTEVQLSYDGIYPTSERDFHRLIESIATLKAGTLLVPVSPSMPDPYTISRFVCKVAVEALAQRFLFMKDGIEELVDHSGLDPIRIFVRHGRKDRNEWKYHYRPLYNENALFTEDSTQSQILHEWTFLQTDTQETLFILAIFGLEFAISIDRPDITEYLRWLAAHNNISPLYPDGDQPSI